MSSIGFLGAGKVVETIVRGLLLAEALPASQMAASAPTNRNLKLIEELGVMGTNSNKEIITNHQTVFISVKPNMVATVLKEISPAVTPNHMLVSLAAGISIGFIESKLPVGTRVIRAMPNTPCGIGQGATMYTCGSAVKAEDKALVEKYFNSLGYCMEGDETMIDSVMAVSGSGPAYAYIAIDALADGGVKMGLPRDIAVKLAAQTLLGSAKLVLQGRKHPSELKDDVCSPGGATIDAIHELERGGFRKCLIEAVEAACLRAKELNAMNAQNK
ncbi:pyrroline-5-carboxylate reductase 2-like [Acanthaster planci]|uniref:Pyrroline-5-carboxylate reductase n=1 Tax=Acanthaster planci TaxID=133434 RepID=A0A8B7ZCN8_ACAPL|nr:pyrroline-5-carboxylate reductase 2-like [Acanthaster planci]XP_022102745.1 pyrroline-5-carboxylate reductase 2-like [Acanthaster planci]XP_022102746.1 pyrroline-5-carboxylate reductase 2-like [Acanthaster planci]XP_022102747.1 pyrroline-5-carboxylate reductase 2-like [Acanthaster planci]XP_022102748.1 pyrroline-5-carboxylate reductase 2-like [Acanthaster planci]